MDNQYSVYISNENPTLKESYCAFIDILGFTEDMISAAQQGQEQILLDKLISALKIDGGILKPKLGGSDKPLWASKIFTDNVVLGYPLHNTDGEGEFGFLIHQLSYYQMRMALEGFFIRGGFSIGNLYMDEDLVYGSALLSAYSIENKVSNTPRIVLSKEVVELVNRHLKYYGDPKEAPQNSDILIDADNQYFINYLITTVIGDQVIDQAIMKHKEEIEKNLIKFSSVPRIWSKYLWIANYHNYFCELIKEYKGYHTNFLIDNNLAVQRPRRLVS